MGCSLKFPALGFGIGANNVGGSGEANIGSNLGAGSQVYASKLGTALQFRTLSNADSAISVAENGNLIEIGLNQSAINTDNITEGSTNLFYTETLFNNSLSGKTTDDLTEGSTNLYLTSAEQTKLGYISVTQAVDLDQLESDVNNLSAVTNFIGEWDASGGTFPASTTAGDTYICSTAGTVDGISFLVGDILYSLTDNASTTVYASNWLKNDGTGFGVVSGEANPAQVSAVEIAAGTETALRSYSVADVVNLISQHSPAAGAHTHIADDIVPLASEWTNFNNHLNL